MNEKYLTDTVNILGAEFKLTTPEVMSYQEYRLFVQWLVLIKEFKGEAAKAFEAARDAQNAKDNPPVRINVERVD
ncbi:MAG: hypothetical protein KIH63_004625 [Candidatus Saccharibacteria bacterium]|nr:hypothetical protein [Candidatus Saccharibacteria bacterium]